MAMKLFQLPFPISAPPLSNSSHNPNPLSSHLHHSRRTSTELRLSRLNNASAIEFEDRQRSLKDEEDNSQASRSNFVGSNVPAGTKARNKVSTSGRRSKYSKPDGPKPGHPAFRQIAKFSKRAHPVDRTADVKLSEDGLSYVVDGAPFEFKYSYTEGPKAKPLKLREPPFSPFGPVTMPRPWTGRPPTSKQKPKKLDSLQASAPGTEMVEPVQPPGPFQSGIIPKYVKTREEVLGDPLSKEEITDLVAGCIKSKRQLNMGRDGLTHNMLDNIHSHWKRRMVCKIKCKGVCTVDMDNVCQELEQRTGGKIIYKKGGVVYLFRGRNYQYRNRPQFPLMMWKPAAPVYPRLIEKAPAGLTLDEASEMRKKGRSLIPMCKLGKNGLYSNLADNVREAFEECELVRINCEGMNRSDYRKIGGKLKDLVPCVLISFENEHILMWRGKDWSSSLTKPSSNDEQSEASSVAPKAEDPKVLERNMSPPIMSQKQAGIADRTDLCVPSNAVPAKEEIHQKRLAVEALASTDVSQRGTTTSLDPSCASFHESEKTAITSDNIEVVFSNDMASGKQVPEEGSESSNVTSVSPEQKTTCYHQGKPTDLSLPCVQGVVKLLKQAFENGTATSLEGEDLDPETIYKRTVAFSRSAPPGPVFRHRQRSREGVEPNSETKETVDSGDVEVAPSPPAATPKIGGKERRSSRFERKKEEQLELVCGGAVGGSLGLDELAKLLS